jgi:hypothetical protein
MGLEAGTWIDDLVVTNPPSTDDKRQGDDHLRLIKQVLKNSLKRTSGRPVYFPTSSSVTASYTILDSDENTIFRCDTTAGPFDLTLPNTLTTTNAGWKVIVVKVNTHANPVFIVPPAPTLLDGFSKIRRTRENKATEIMWTGVGWVATRPDSAPIGAAHEYYGAALPNGYLWASGAAFAAADFVELNAVLGGNVTPDLRGRGSIGRDDMGGAAANRVTAGVSGIPGTTLFGAGGAQSIALDTNTLPSHVHDLRSGILYGGSLGISSEVDSAGTGQDHAHSWGGSFSTGGVSAHHVHVYDKITGVPKISVQAGGGATVVADVITTASGTGEETAAADHSHSGSVSGTTGGRNAGHFHYINGTTQPQGGNAAHNNMPPTAVCNKIIVAE